MAPAGCELIDMQVVKHYKTWSLHTWHISTYTSHLVAIPYHNTPCKNKLDASNLLIACFTWLMGATLKNGFYLRKATILILELPKSCCKSNDNYSGRYSTHQPHVWRRLLRSRSHERCHVKLAWATSIPLCRAIKKYTKRSLQQKHLRIYLLLIPLKGFVA
jgi:hypothetical protein